MPYWVSRPSAQPTGDRPNPLPALPGSLPSPAGSPDSYTGSETWLHLHSALVPPACRYHHSDSSPSASTDPATRRAVRSDQGAIAKPQTSARRVLTRLHSNMRLEPQTKKRPSCGLIAQGATVFAAGAALYATGPAPVQPYRCPAVGSFGARALVSARPKSGVLTLGGEISDPFGPGSRAPHRASFRVGPSDPSGLPSLSRAP